MIEEEPLSEDEELFLIKERNHILEDYPSFNPSQTKRLKEIDTRLDELGMERYKPYFDDTKKLIKKCRRLLRNQINFLAPGN